MAKKLIPFWIAFLFIVISSEAQERIITFRNKSVSVTFEGIDDWEFKPIQDWKQIQL